MSKAPSMPLFCGDYLSDTKHLTLEQHGAYLVLLMVTWRNNGQAIKDDPDLIARYLGCTRDRWLKKIRPTLEPMFDLGQGTWRSLKLEDQWAYVQAAIAVKRENGKKGGRPSSEKPEQNSQSLSNETASLIPQSSNANTLKDNDSAKAVGYFSVSSSETNQPQPLFQRQESKKESYVACAVISEIPKFSSEAVVTVPTAEKMPSESPDFSLLIPDADPPKDDLAAKFEEFWKAYPRRASGEGKQESKDLFVSAVRRGVDADELIRCAAAFRECMILDGATSDEVSGRTNFVMQCSKFLNFSKKRWEEWPDVLARKKTVSNNVHPLRPGNHRPPQQQQRRTRAVGVPR
jgi:uncharacterized protein YdaU (DUF1376 family)